MRQRGEVARAWASLCFMRFPPVGWTASVCHRRVLPRATRSVASPPGFGSSAGRGWAPLFRPSPPAPPPGSGLGVGVCANMFPVLARVRVHTRTGCLRRFPRISPSVCAPSALRGLLGSDPRVTGMDRAWLCDASLAARLGSNLVSKPDFEPFRAEEEVARRCPWTSSTPSPFCLPAVVCRVWLVPPCRRFAAWLSPLCVAVACRRGACGCLHVSVRCPVCRST